MKKILTLFAIFSFVSLPTLAASRRAICERAITFDKFSEWPQKYRDMATQMLNAPLTEPIQVQYTTGVGCTAQCTAGQKLIDCTTPEKYAKGCASAIAAQHIQDKYIAQFKQELCGHLSDTEQSSTDEIFNGDKISYWLAPQENQTQSSSSTADTNADDNPTNDDTPAPTPQNTITISGKIIGPTIDGTNTEPYIGATVLVIGTTTGATTDLDGNFTLSNVPENAPLEISYVGCTPQTLTAKSNMGTITLDCGKQLDEVVVVACSIDKANGIRQQQNIDGKCYPTECVTPRWELSGTEKNAKCVEQKCQFENGTGEWVADGDNWTCQLKSCDTAKGYKKNDDSTACVPMLKNCTDNQKAEHPNAKSTGIKEGTEECIATECKCGFNLTDGKCVAWPDGGVACTMDTTPKLPANAASATMACNNNGKVYCKITTCNDDYEKNADATKCDSQKGDPCTSSDKNAKRAEYKKDKNTKKLTCIIKECNSGYDVSKDGTKCVPECECGKEYDSKTNTCIPWTDTACNDTQKPKLPSNATAGTKKCDGKSAYCVVTACADGFKISDDKKSCVTTRGDDCDATSVDKNATAGTNKSVKGKITCVITACGHGFKPNKDGTKCVAAELSEEDSLAKIDKLKDNAQKMKEKEQSTENKLLGAAGIGATGIGAMQMLSASAEQSADQDAEAAMRAYLATFHCNYGMGKNIAGGEKQVELPGGNELVGLYAEYVNLANDLKVRKNALGMRAGIESESILDSATSGLYDDIALGKTSGAYTSLARAIMDPTGPDAIAWAAQKSDSADKLKTGAITAGIGALGSLAGNLAINSGDAKKNKVNDIIAEFDKKKKIFQDLESDIQKIPPQVEKCPAGTTGTNHPNCTCTGNAEYNTNTKQCDACTVGQSIVDGKCTCTGDTPLWDEQNKKCIKQTQQCTAKCTPSDGSHLIVQQDCSCTCIDGFTITNDGKSCTCNEHTHEIKDGKCVKKSAPVKPVDPQPVAEPIVITLPADSLFELGSAEISDTAKPALNKFITDMKNNGIKNCKLTINGYTDCTGSTKFNQTLSENRANAVKTYLTTNGTDVFDAAHITTNGMGEGTCSCGVAPIPSGKETDPDYKQCKGQTDNYTNNNNLRYAPCRRVTIELDTTSCQSNTGGDLGSIIQTVTSNIKK